MKLLKSLLNKYRDVLFTLKHPGQNNSMTYGKYPKECTFDGKSVLNIGCGYSTYPSPNVINIDAIQSPGVNIAHDLNKTPLPFPDNTFDFIIANHILEHLPNWWDCFKELARVVKVGGIIEVWLPGDGTYAQMGYRDHVSVINNCSFTGVRGTSRNSANIWANEDKKTHGFIQDLDIIMYVQRMVSFWWIAIMPQSIQLWMAIYLRNTVAEQGWKFLKLPPEREKIRCI